MQKSLPGIAFIVVLFVVMSAVGSMLSNAVGSSRYVIHYTVCCQRIYL